jgi:carnosine N-methyltransferase
VSAIEVSTSTSTDANKDTSIAKVETNFTWWSERNAQIFRNKVETYDSIRQVIAHIVRDWSSTEGSIIRDAIYRWCVEQLQVYQYTSSNGPILVPGAGLGRLVWDISQNIDGTVEGLESSVCMTAAAHTIFHTKRKNAFVLHPFAADSFSNEIDHEARYDIISFPDVKPSIRVGTVSYTVGIFGLENMQHCANRYGAIVTSFFIDTATTVYDFISTIAMVLSDGGLWINVGPLQWHINNKVPVSVNELYMMLKHFRDQTTGHHVFQILHWSVDEHPIRYRNHGGRNRSTYYDGYCPLRFVIRKK